VSDQIAGGVLDATDIGHPMLDIPIGGTMVPKEEIKRAPILKIEVIEGFAVPKNTVLEINA